MRRLLDRLGAFGTKVVVPQTVVSGPRCRSGSCSHAPLVDQPVVPLLEQRERGGHRRAARALGLGVGDELCEVVVVEREAEAAVVPGSVTAALKEESLVGEGATHEQTELSAQGAEAAGELVELGVGGVAGVVLALDEDVLARDAVVGKPGEEAVPSGVGVADVDALAPVVLAVLDLGVDQGGVEQGAEQPLDGTVERAGVLLAGVGLRAPRRAARAGRPAEWR